jgi:hypothetical protein
MDFAFYDYGENITSIGARELTRRVRGSSATRGAEAWLDSHSAARVAIFPRKSVDIPPAYRASSRHR